LLKPRAPGQLVDIRADGGGPFCLHLWRQGQGRPAAILDTGLGGNSLAWANVLPKVAQVTEACAYDRAGSGWSDPAPPNQARTSQRIVEELRLALGVAGIKPPHILVGHSAGAIHMLVYAKRHPEEVAGLVLVEPSHPEMFTRLKEVPGPGAMVALYGGLAGLRRLGLLRWLGPAYLKMLLPDGARNLPPEAWQALRYFAAQGHDYAAARREASAADESFASARIAPGALGSLPLIVLTADWWVTGKPSKLKQRFVPLREEMALLSTRGRHIIVTGCDHASLPLKRADAVADAVREVLALRVERRAPD
jgi:pimeloyl-ACP methyl ester carboxylesterase